MIVSLSREIMQEAQSMAKVISDNALKCSNELMPIIDQYNNEYTLLKEEASKVFNEACPRNSFNQTRRLSLNLNAFRDNKDYILKLFADNQLTDPEDQAKCISSRTLTRSPNYDPRLRQMLYGVTGPLFLCVCKNGIGSAYLRTKNIMFQPMYGNHELEFLARDHVPLIMEDAKREFVSDFIDLRDEFVNNINLHTEYILYKGTPKPIHKLIRLSFNCGYDASFSGNVYGDDYVPYDTVKLHIPYIKTNSDQDGGIRLSHIPKGSTSVYVSVWNAGKLMTIREIGVKGNHGYRNTASEGVPSMTDYVMFTSVKDEITDSTYNIHIYDLVAGYSDLINNAIECRKTVIENTSAKLQELAQKYESLIFTNKL